MILCYMLPWGQFGRSVFTKFQYRWSEKHFLHSANSYWGVFIWGNYPL